MDSSEIIRYVELRYVMDIVKLNMMFVKSIDRELVVSVSFEGKSPWHKHYGMSTSSPWGTIE